MRVTDGARDEAPPTVTEPPAEPATPPSGGHAGGVEERPRGGALRVLRHRDFRLIAGGNMVSQLGFWAQYVAVGWAARSLTDSDFLVTASFAAQWLPALVLGPIAGVMADRYDRRRLVMFGNLAMVVPPVIIGLLIQTDAITLLSLVLLVILGGCGQAFTQPATVAFLPALVPHDELHDAVALNSGLSNSTRVIGPTMAGAIIAAWGVAWGFHINAISFLAVALACLLVKVRPPAPPPRTEGMRAQLRAGLAYTRANDAVGRLILLVAVQSFFMMHAALMPIFARDVLDGDVSTYARLSAAPGIGFLLGACMVTLLRTGRQRRAGLIGCSLAIGAALFVVGVSRSIAVTVGALGVFGFGQFMLTTLVTTMLMMASTEAYRGRVMGVYLMLTVGMFPINSLVAGALASVLGAPLLVSLCGAVILGFVVLFCATGGLAVIRAGTDNTTEHAEEAAWRST